ncbi:hypothetical protein [Streptomyces litchfieldiae]|uniref:Tetratricopeptide repeat protein n=1 Tax=Streptomyces litchfieldiae TaxID=3075543 RepID=A0ABU2MSM8_9ACTN|nr:hypothetical protein [Streptomyces sp. DSM 44938]MDT0343614.1 hypothetical protein [Streptomyces sp. DSM 44938]
MGTGPSAGYAGLRRVIRTLEEEGADFGELRHVRAAEWAVLAPAASDDVSSDRLEDVTIPASERRLHRESEHTFRVLAAAAVALCQGSDQLGRPLLLRGAGRADLPSLRGVIRAAEYQRATGVGAISVASDHTPNGASGHVAAAATALDFATDRARCLELIGVPDEGQDRPPLLLGAALEPDGAAAEERLFARALHPAGTAVDRLVAVIGYLRLAFKSANWEGAALAADGCLPLTRGLSAGAVARIAGSLTASGSQAFELEPETFRHPADIRAFLLKSLGIQATFRELHDDAVRLFRAMRDTRDPISPELVAQSHLYSALTLVKRRNAVAEAVKEVEQGLATLPEARGESDTLRRERGWLHNLRGLTHVVQRDLLAALRHEKAAWSCLEGLTDASSVHLRVNLISNISVLQERAGKHAQALRTWEKFAGSGFTDDAKFVKHHSYRAGGLTLAHGDREEGEALLRRSLARCDELADDFHTFEIAAELATLRLDRGDAPRASAYFDQAATAAGALGDPYRTALARVGGAVAAGRTPAPAVAELALRSASNARRAQDLAKRLRGGGADELRASLPTVRTKLNRPFDLVNY